MNLLKHAILILPALFGAVLAITVAASEPLEKPPRYVLGDTTYVVRATPEVMKGIKTTPPPEEWSKVFFVQAAGPRHNYELGQAGSKSTPWGLLRALPYPRSMGSTRADGPRGYVIVFERPLTRKWVNMFTMSDMSVPGVSRPNNRERIVVQLTNLEKGVTAQSTFKLFYGSGGLPELVCLPAEKVQGASIEKGIYFNADRVARSQFHNVYISVRPNFSDVRSSDEFYKPPAAPPIVLAANAAIRDYLGQPFPSAKNILHAKVDRLIKSVSIDSPKVWARKPARINICLGTPALQMPEIVRLKASNGGFQRKNDEILYKCEEPGNVTITLEVMGGGHGDGTFDFAERETIKITVVN